MNRNLFPMAFLLIVIISGCNKSNGINPSTTSNSLEGSTSQHKLAGRSSNSISGSLHFSATTSYSLPCDCGTYIPDRVYYGTGTISHLGLSTSLIKPCIAPLYSGSVMTGFHVGLECNRLIAANGDELYLNINPYDIMFAASDANGIANCDITGGTGRFSGATGSFSSTISVHLILGTADLNIKSGTINY